MDAASHVGPASSGPAAGGRYPRRDPCAFVCSGLSRLSSRSARSCFPVGGPPRRCRPPPRPKRCPPRPPRRRRLSRRPRLRPRRSPARPRRAPPSPRRPARGTADEPTRRPVGADTRDAGAHELGAPDASQQQHQAPRGGQPLRRSRGPAARPGDGAGLGALPRRGSRPLGARLAPRPSRPPGPPAPGHRHLGGTGHADPRRPTRDGFGTRTQGSVAWRPTSPLPTAPTTTSRTWPPPRRASRPGTSVAQGQIVGFVGDSGNARGGPAHCHFEIHPRGGAAIDPKPILDRWTKEATAYAFALASSPKTPPLLEPSLVVLERRDGGLAQPMAVPPRPLRTADAEQGLTGSLLVVGSLLALSGGRVVRRVRRRRADGRPATEGGQRGPETGP